MAHLFVSHRPARLEHLSRYILPVEKESRKDSRCEVNLRDLCIVSLVIALAIVLFTHYSGVLIFPQ